MWRPGLLLWPLATVAQTELSELSERNTDDCEVRHLGACQLC